MERLYFPQPLRPGMVELEGAEAHHLLHVMRASVGDRVGLFSGQGDEALAELVGHSKRSAQLRITECWTSPVEADELVLATAMPKGDRARWLVEKGTELGVSRIIPLRTARSVVEPGEGKLDKLMQAAVAACKQSGRSRLPQIDPLTPLEELLRRFVDAPSNQRLVLLDPHAEQAAGSWMTSLNDHPRSVIALIGPEGGFTADEHSAAIAAGATPVRLGPHILRIETAAIAICAAFGSRG